MISLFKRYLDEDKYRSYLVNQILFLSSEIDKKTKR